MRDILLLLFLIFLSFMIGGLFLMYLGIGLIMFIGFIITVESISPLRYLVYRFSNLLDIFFMLFNVYITISMGVTVGVSFIFFNLLYSWIYKRHWIRGKLRDSRLSGKQTNK